MRTTVALDENLLIKAREHFEPDRMSAVIEEALRALTAREASRRLVKFGGAVPGAKAPPRRRFDWVIFADTSVWIDCFDRAASPSRERLVPAWVRDRCSAIPR